MDEHPKPEPKRSLSHTGIEYNLRFFSNQIINLKQAGDYVHTDIPQATMNAANEEVQRQEALKYLSNRVNIGVLLRIRNLHVIQTRNTDPNLLHDQINELVSSGNVIITDPLGYLDFLKLMNHAKFVMTDSGGIQEETTILQIPCITLRDETERPVTSEVGTNIIVGTDSEKVITEANKIISNQIKIGKIPPLWDGHASKRIIDILLGKIK